MNRAYNATFQPGRLSVGLFLPIEEYGPEDVPSLERHIERVQLAERLGFAAVWLRDVPFNVPAFGDVGQIFDPFVYLGALAACTNRIGLGVGSVILPLRHPAHVAKAAASADSLSGGRVMLGIASGDRPEEYPALNMDYDSRGARFRDSVHYMRTCFDSFPKAEFGQGTFSGHIDMLPKPVAGQVPLLVTGGSQQSVDWTAAHGDGWITYPRNDANQRDMIDTYRRHVAQAGDVGKPVMQSLYVDVLDTPDARTRPIVLGYQAGTSFLVEHLQGLQQMGVNHVALNLRYNYEDIEDTLHRLAQDVLPHFAPHDATAPA